MLLETLITAFAGLLGLAIGLLIPRLNWISEQKRKQHDARVQLIASVRSVLAAPPPLHEFRQSPLYAQLRPHLSHGTIQRIESVGEHSIVMVVGSRQSGVNPYATDVLDDVAKLEKGWGLI
jgi:hypothetical protein